ncbi:hypothetical protein C0J52_13013 [Blattella germanica]|nr:hypothetical protein C0J52_13013 [Blattella germanica]
MNLTHSVESGKMGLYTNIIFIVLIVSAAKSEPLLLKDALHLSGWACRNPEFTEMFYPPCACAEDCRRYGDCCQDSEYFHSEEQMWGASPFSCASNGGTYYFMKSCPSNWKDEATVQKCLSVDYTYRDPMLDVPVTSSRTNITYLNGHCAICHGDFDPSIDYIWNIEFTCPEYRETNYGDFNFNNIGFGSFNNSNFGSFNDNYNVGNFPDNSNFGGFPVNSKFGGFTDNSNVEGFRDNSNLEGFNNSLNEGDFHENSNFRSFRNKSNFPGLNDYSYSFEESYYPNYSDLTESLSPPSNLKKYHDYVANTEVRPRPSISDLFYNDSESSWNWNKTDGVQKCYVSVLVPDVVKYSSLLRSCEKNLIATCADNWTDSVIHEKCLSYTDIWCQLHKIYRNPFCAYCNYQTIDHLGNSGICFQGPMAGAPAMRSEFSVLLDWSSLDDYKQCSKDAKYDPLKKKCRSNATNAVTMHYILLTSFAWMFIISFDVWRAIRASTTKLRTTSGNKWKLFFAYSLAAWFSPAFVVAIPLTLQITEIDTNFRPGYGEINCWISSKNALLLFVVAPLLIVMVFNLWFFSWTAWLIHSTRNETAKKSTSTTDFRMFLKLAIVMGLTWITGLIAGVAGYKIVWFLFVALNTLQGLFIFVSFSCTVKIWKELTRGRSKPGSTTSRSQPTKTTRGHRPLGVSVQPVRNKNSMQEDTRVFVTEERNTLLTPRQKHQRASDKMGLYTNIIVTVLFASAAETEFLFLKDALHLSGWACNNPKFSAMRDPPCACTEDCRRYGDCCQDSEYFHAEEQMWGASSFPCTYIGNMHGTYYVMKSCPPNWKYEDTLQKCLSVDYSYRDPMLDVPVTSYRTNITYLNGHCAICHEDFDPSIDYIWSIEFTCPEYHETNYGDFNIGTNNFSIGIMNNNFTFGSFNDDLNFGNFNNNSNFGGFHDNYNFGNFNNSNVGGFPHYSNFPDYSDYSYPIQLPQYPNFTNFTDSFFPPTNWTKSDDYVMLPSISDLFYNESDSSWYWNKTDTVQKCYASVFIPNVAWHLLRSCEKNLIATCADSWTDSVILEKCFSYTDIWCQPFEIYRNPFCAYCNFKIIANLGHSGVCLRQPSAHAGYRSEFSILLDWSSLDNYKQCSKNAKYDPLKKECRSNSTIGDSGMGMDTLTLVFLSISIFFLVLHLIVFFATLRLRNMPSMNLASLCISLLLLYCCFIANGFLEPPCMVTAVAMHYSLLASFAWMFIISFDIWRAIRASTIKLRTISGSKWKLFFAYSLAAWFSPAFVVAISLTLQITEIDTNFRPGYGEINCWISSKNALLLFVVAPLLIVMVFNLWFFSWTAWLIHSTRNETAKKSTSTTDFRMFLKLAIIMGLTWITGLLAGVAGYKPFWFLFIALNTLQGLFIFVSFSCTVKIWKELTRGKSKPGSTLSRSQPTRTTQSSLASSTI